METVNLATLKEKAEQLFARAIAGEPTIIEQDGKRTLLLCCPGAIPDFVLYPQLNALIEERIHEPAREATERDWEMLRCRVVQRKG
jgi:hypothetical protein